MKHMLTNTYLLKSKMIMHGDTIQSLAQAIGNNHQSLSLKINNRREFKQSDIVKISARYRLTPNEIADMFCQVCDHSA